MLIDFLQRKLNSLVLIVLLSLVVIISGIFYYKSEENRIRNEKYNELEAIAKLKIGQFEQWKNEREADAIVASKGNIFTESIERYLNEKNNIEVVEEIKNRLLLIKNNYNYENILLTNTDGEILISAEPDSAYLYSFTFQKISEVIDSNKIIFSDLYKCGTHKTIHYDVIAPVTDQNKKLLAILILRTNPSTYLYPLIEQWPTSSKTAETLLLRKENDKIVFLNELRHKKNSVLNFSIPLSQIDIPAIKAALGYKGMFSGKDYRGVEVVSYVSSVPETDWFMVAKIDKSEMLDDLNFRAVAITIVSILIILMLSAGLGFIYNSRQKNIYKSLWQTQEEARTTLYSIGDGVLITDEKNNVKQLNPVAERLTGWREKEAKGKSIDEIFNIVNDKTKVKVEVPTHKILKDGGAVEITNHTLLISKDGKETPVADKGAPIKNENGLITGAVLVFRDQSLERQKQKQLEESELKYKSLFTSTNDGICLHEIITYNGQPVDYLITDVNKKYEEITGLKREDAIGKKATDLYKSETAPYLEIYSDVALNGNHCKFETFYKPMNKHFAISVYSPEKGKFATVFQDITDRKKAEEALILSEHRLKRAQEIANLGSWEYNLVENKLNWTEEVYRIFGLQPNEVIPSYEMFLEFVHPDDREIVNEAYNNSLEKGNDTYEIEHRIVRQNSGEIRYVHEKCEHLRDETGKIIRSVGMVHDITERKNYELRLKDVLDDLKRSNRELEQFASVASHDLQEPLRMVKNYTDLLMRRYGESFHDDQKEFFGYVSEGAKRMHELISALLQYSRISTGEKIFEDVDLNEITIDIIKDLEVMIEETDTKIIFDQFPEVKGNKTMLRQLLQNLIQNAIKFRGTKTPEIKISCERNGDFWKVKVEDNGIGIAPEYHEKIFMIFQRLHREEYPGTGIGLAVCKKIVHYHGGEIGINSVYGKGATFHFTLPIR